MQQSGLIDKLLRDVKFEMVRSSKGELLQINPGGTLRFSQVERRLTLVDTEGMFILLGIGFAIAAGTLLSEVVGGLTNRVGKILKKRKDDKKAADKVEQDRMYQETHLGDIENDAGNNNAETVSIGSSNPDHPSSPSEGFLEVVAQKSDRSDGSGHSRNDSVCVSSLNKHVLHDLYHGPKKRHSNMVMIDGKYMTEDDAVKYSNSFKLDVEASEKRASNSSNISKLFGYLGEEDSFDTENAENEEMDENWKTCEVEINHVSTADESEQEKVDLEAGFGEKVEHEDLATEKD